MREVVVEPPVEPLLVSGAPLLSTVSVLISDMLVGLIMCTACARACTAQAKGGTALQPVDRQSLVLAWLANT